MLQRLTRSLPYDITANVSLYNLNPEETVINKSVPENTIPTEEPASEGPGNRMLSAGSSALEYLYNATGGNGKFNKVVDFLGIMAEAESFKGKQTSNASSSASGIFHFLVGNGGGHTKEGKKERLGQYDAKGVLRTSSFETAKKRLRVMMGSKAYSDSIARQPGLVQELNSVLKASTPDDLSPQRQAILAFANLKMTSGDFDSYLEGKQKAEDVYGKVWVTRGKTHSNPEIAKNWRNAVNRSAGTSHHQYFGITNAGAAAAFGDNTASPHPYGAGIPTGKLHNGGVISQKIIANKTLV